jgi:hypothetical protein
MNKFIKFTIAILLFLCLADMPYGYYQFVRFIAMLAFAYLAFLSSQEQKHNEMFIFIGLAILFQPLIKISLGRTMWNVVDVIVGIGLVISIITKRNKN